MEAFVSDPSPRAFDAAVERLLASPHFGERQARMWLDLARYADTTESWLGSTAGAGSRPRHRSRDSSRSTVRSSRPVRFVGGDAAADPWVAFCHALLGSNEFLFVD